MLPNFQPKTITVDGGTLAYEVAGTGPLILCLPGLGDVRQEYDRLAPKLAEAGFRVMVADLRGHGGSSVGWSRYDVPALASDIGPLLNAEGAKLALLVGCSISGASTANFAAYHKERVAGLVGLGPIRREPFTGMKAKLMPLVLHAMFADPWGVWAWGHYYRTLYPSAPPDDLNQYIATLKANLLEPGRFAAMKDLMFSGREPSHLRAIRVPVLDFIGTADPDFDNPQAEAAWSKAMMPQAEVHLVEGLGHYIHREHAEMILPRVINFAKQTLLSHQLDPANTL